MNYVNPRTEEAYQLFHNGILALSRAESQGIRVDVEYIENKKSHLTRKIERLEKQFAETTFYSKWKDSQKGEVNIHSHTQLANYLYKTRRIRILKETASGQGSTDEDTLKQLNIPELDKLLEIRKLKKVRDTYLDSYLREQVGGVIHAFFDLHLVKSYRGSSNSPNLQNVPKRDEETMQMVRGAMYPRINHQLLEIDFKALEVAISCCYNKDANLIKYIKDPKTDMHADMAVQLFKLDKFDKEKHNILRQAAKNGFVFPEFYGDYFVNCAENMACGWGKLSKGRWKEGEGIEFDGTFLSDHLISKGITTLKKFENHVEKIENDFWGNRFADYATWKDRWYKTYRKYGYIDLLTGFRCSGVMTKNEVINMPVQGSAFHCLLWSFIMMDKFIIENKLDSRLIGQVHDSMLFDILPDELPLILKKVYEVTTIDLLKAWDWIIVPLAIEAELAPVNASWADKNKIDIF